MSQELEIPNPLVFDTIELKHDDLKHEFKFLRIDRPEKLVSADSVHYSYRLPVLGTNRFLEIPVRGISYAEYENVEYKYISPPDGEGEEYDAKVQDVLLKRHVELIELSIGKKFPGENFEEKKKWLENIGVGELDAVYSRIIEHYSNFSDGSLLETYETAFKGSDGNRPEIIRFNDFDDWIKASEGGYTFRMNRPFEDYICEINLRKISEAKRKEIDDSTKPPTPPSRPGINPATKQPDPTFTKYNYDDPAWKNASRAVERKRIVLLLDSLLPFEIPGSTIDEKYQWVGARLFGDIFRIRRFIDQQVMNYRSRFNFFTDS